MSEGIQAAGAWLGFVGIMYHLFRDRYLNGAVKEMAFCSICVKLAQIGGRKENA